MNELLEKTRHNLDQLFGQGYERVWRLRFGGIANSVRGTDRLLRHIINAREKDDITDHLAVAQYAFVFVGLSFGVVIEPLGSEGPDLEISKNSNKAFVEVMRFRKIFPGPMPLIDEFDPRLLPYGNLPRDTQKAWAKIIDKFRQVKDGESIIAIWNDDEDMEEIEVEEATRSLRSASRQIQLNVPAGLSFIVYGSNWIGPGRDELEQQFHCFQVSPSLKPHQRDWLRKIESATLRELIERALQQQPKPNSPPKL